MMITKNAMYLDPKADVTFKKVFSDPVLLRSFLNSLLPLDDDRQIEDIEYLPTEIPVVNPFRKSTIVDVRCKDQQGRQFVVEMQMEWTNAFMQRVLFNASKAYVSQAGVGHKYENLMPVYSLSLLNDTYTSKDNPEFIHNYNIVCDEETRLVINGLHFTFVELPKFKPDTFLQKRMAVLWLRYLTEISEDTKEAPQDLLDDPNTNKALRMLHESALSEMDLWAYDKFWDIISYERTLYSEKYKDGLERGYSEGMEEGRKKGMEEGRKKGMKDGIEKGMKDGIAKGMKDGIEKGMKDGIEKGMKDGIEKGILSTARNLKAKGLPTKLIMEVTGLSEEDVTAL